MKLLPHKMASDEEQDLISGEVRVLRGILKKMSISLKVNY